jgi:predicted aspartyl protease
MVAPVQINGHPANLLVDTGASETMLDTESAQLCNVAANQFGGRRYIGYRNINGQLAPIAFVRNLDVGAMNFGNLQVALVDSSARGALGDRVANHAARIDGVLGADILAPRKAVINTRAKLIFFPLSASEPAQLAGIAALEKFTRVPMRREENGGFTVACLVGGQRGRVFVDTGAFVTTFSNALFRTRGVALESAHVSAQFSDGISRRYAMAEVKDFAIGDFKVPSKKVGVASLPRLGSAGADAPVLGIVGMDLLYDCNAIIDFGSMSLFLK